MRGGGGGAAGGTANTGGGEGGLTGVVCSFASVSEGSLSLRD